MNDDLRPEYDLSKLMRLPSEKFRKMQPKEVPTWHFIKTLFDRLTPDERSKVVGDWCKACWRNPAAACNCTRDD